MHLLMLQVISDERNDMSVQLYYHARALLPSLKRDEIIGNFTHMNKANDSSQCSCFDIYFIRFGTL